MEKFWLSWDKESRRIYGILAIIFAFILGSTLYFYFVGFGNSIHWDTLRQEEKTTVIVDKVETGIFTIPIEANAKIVFSQFIGTEPLIDLWQIRLFSILTIGLVLLLLSTFSYLQNWLYYLSTLVLLSYFVFQQPDMLAADKDNYRILLALPVGLFGVCSYYFFAFNKKARFAIRFAAFVLIASFYYGVLLFLGNISNPEIHLFNYGAVVLSIFAIGFIFLVSFENVYLFLSLVNSTKATGKSNNTVQFIIIYLLYTANLLLQYLKNRGIITFEVLFVSPFFLFISSAIFGIWGFKERSVMFSKTLPFNPLGAVVYLAWAGLAFLAMGYAFAMGNDPLVEVYEDVILFSHLGFGFGFFVYVAWNYNQWMDKELKVSKLIYQYRWVSFLTVYATGILIFLCLFFYSNMFIYRQWMAGYYNFVGDVYYKNNDVALAEMYYKDASSWEFQNHKTNYTLATLYQRMGNPSEAIKYYRKANLKQPSAYAYANMAALKYFQGRELDPILDLKEGLQYFNNSGELKNNLGLMFEKIHFPDSCIHYLNEGVKESTQTLVLESNKAALFAKYGVDKTNDIKPDYLDNITYATNVLALHLAFNKKSNARFLLTDTVLNASRSHFLNNYMLSTKGEKQDTLAYSYLEKAFAADTNIAFKTDIQYLISMADFYRSKPVKAVKSIDLLQIGDPNSSGFYLNTLGLWTLKQGLNEMAADIFEMASQKGNTAALVNKAIAYAEAKKYIKLADALSKIDIGDSSNRDVVNRLSKIILPFNSNMAALEDDASKYFYLHYLTEKLTDEQRGNIFFSLTEERFVLKSARSLYYFYKGLNDSTRCGEIVAELSNKNNLAKLPETKLLILDYLYISKKYTSLEEALTKIDFDDPRLAFYNAVVEKEVKNNPKKAADFFELAVNERPYDEQTVLKTTEFYHKELQNDSRAFNILLDAIALNPYSVALHKAYCYQSIYYGIPTFAESGLERLQQICTIAEYATFKKQFETFKKAHFEAILGY